LVRAVEENPALHTQSLNPSLSGGESEPVGQLTHVLAPDVEYLPGMQSRQAADDEAPDVPEYLPGSQGVQAAEDNPDHVPGTHEVQ
jgi:hypothetical protein